MKRHPPSRNGTLRQLQLLCGAIIGLLPCALAIAGLTDISNVPLASNNPAQAKPNVMLLMDTSGSMGWSHMPDSVEGALAAGVKTVGYKNSSCNALYYNRTQSYGLPRAADGTFLTQPSFTSARYDAYDTASSVLVNLATAFKAYDDFTLGYSDRVNAGQAAYNDTAQPAYYYIYTGTQLLVPAAAPCTDLEPAVDAGAFPATGGGSWTKVVVSATSGPAGADERQNFANWYAYYRIRMSLVKSAASLAFNALTDSFRVGFITVQPKDNPTDAGINTAKYLAINDFNATQRAAWYAKLFSQKPGGASPAREGLARVGRHYAGKQDGINTNMTGDPVQYSCQQNFTIMTTDGYWNDQTETPNAGPVAIDGVTRVGQQDGVLTSDAGLSPRPIWEGLADGTLTTTDKNNYFYYSVCTGAWANRATVQNLKSTSQLTASVTQLQQSTAQTLQSTAQNLQSTAQLTKSTAQVTQSTSQLMQSTGQKLQSTSQVNRSTSQLQRSTAQITQSTLQKLKSTSQLQKSTSQLTVSTTQITRSTLQKMKSTTQVLKSTSQLTKSTLQNNQTSTQNMKSTLQNLKSTSQIMQRTNQVTQSTSQIRWYNPSSELWDSVASCPSAGTCQTVVTGPTPVASCFPEVAAAGNSYTTKTCTTGNTGPTAVASCIPVSPAAGNAYTTTTCSPVTTTNVPVASCTVTAASAANSYTATSCSQNATGPTAVQTCTAAAAAAGNNYVATTCSTASSGLTPVTTCTPVTPSIANGYTTTTCGSSSTGPTGVASCVAESPSAANNYTTTTCNTVTTSNVPAASCTAASAAAGNNYTATTCNTAATGPTAAATCTAATAAAGNSYTTTTCTQNTTGPTAVASCTPVAAAAGNSYTATTCGTNNTGPTGVASCSAIAPTAGNSYTTTSCNTLTTTNVPAASCTAATAGSTNSYTTTTCTTAVTGPTAVATCTAATAASGNSYTATTCSQTATGPTPVASCTPVAAASTNGYVATTCNTVNGTPVGVATCTPVAASASNSYTAINCNTATTGPTPIASCIPAAASSSNSYTATTCNTATTTAVPVATCTTATAAAGNSYTATVCSQNVTGPTAVAACTPASPSAANAYTSTSCNTVTTGPTGVASCSPVSAAAGNSYTATSCNTVATGPTGVATCTAAAASATNSYVQTSCNTQTSPPTPVASCTPVSAAAANGYTATTCSTNNTPATPVASCTPALPAAGNAYTTTTCSANNTGPLGVASCAQISPTAANNWTTTSCAVYNNTAGVATCSNSAASAANAWLTTSCGQVDSGPTPVATCSNAAPSAGNNYIATSCSVNSSKSELVQDCVASPATAANAWTETTCSSLQGQKLKYQTTTTVTVQSTSGGNVLTGVTPVVTTTVADPVDLDTTCYLPGINPAPALPWPNPVKAGADISPWPVVGPLPSGSCTAWPCSVGAALVGGSVNSLADVAQYYYATDLRPASDWPENIALNNVAFVGQGPEDDRVTWQHMTTFTIALGVSGTLNYRPDYRSGSITSGDFADIRTGVKTWPLWPDASKRLPAGGGVLSWNVLAGTFDDKNYWNDPRSIDDFWHAAVNGRGQYFSAGTPTSVVTGLTGALAGIQARLASGAAAGSSSLQPVVGDNHVYLASYTTSKWSGDLQSREVNPATGAVSTTVDWSAQSKLDAMVKPDCDSRNIYLVREGATNNRVSFAWNSRPCDNSGSPTGSPLTELNATEQAYFNSARASLMSQYATMTDGSAATVDQRTAAAGANLVNFIRGQRGYEGFESNSATKLYREREHVLGDIVNAQPVYVGKAFAKYADAGYSTFKTNQASRTPMVYAAANDGMLHAFYAGLEPDGTVNTLGGKEAWALIPSMVLPNLYKLADNNYANTHTYSVDGTPTIGDIDVNAPAGTGWKTVLVGGLNGGGKGYYAVDVTNPTVPSVLWEFKWSSTCWNGVTAGVKADCHLGYSFGRPLITKLLDGTWVVIVTSGYNNVNSPAQAGDGQGYLYILNASTGTLLYKLSTDAGNATTPSGLAQVINYVDNSSIDNRTLRVYGGDELGNIWRFDVNDTIAPSGREATLLGVARDSTATGQPITTRPELAEINGQPRIFVGTGRLLGPSDLDPAQPSKSQQTQSIYGFIDPLTGSPAYSNLRAALKPLTMTQSGTGATATRTIACRGSTSECERPDGWVINLPDAGERMNVEMKLIYGTLLFGSNVPQSNACSIGGYSWLNFVDFNSGQSVSRSVGLAVSQYVSNALIVGLNAILTGTGSSNNGGGYIAPGVPRAIVSSSDGSRDTKIVPTDTPMSPGRRVSWREVIVQ